MPGARGVDGRWNMFFSQAARAWKSRLVKYESHDDAKTIADTPKMQQSHRTYVKCAVEFLGYILHHGGDTSDEILNG